MAEPAKPERCTGSRVWGLGCRGSGFRPLQALTLKPPNSRYNNGPKNLYKAILPHASGGPGKPTSSPQISTLRVQVVLIYGFLGPKVLK